MFIPSQAIHFNSYITYKNKLAPLAHGVFEHKVHSTNIKYNILHYY